MQEFYLPFNRETRNAHETFEKNVTYIYIHTHTRQLYPKDPRGAGSDVKK